MPATAKAKTTTKSKKTSKPAKAKQAAKRKKAAPRPKKDGGAIRGMARVILYVTDFERAVKFYTETLGLKLAYPAGGGWAELSLGGTALCLHGGREGSMPTKGVSSVSLRVDDFDAAYARLKAAGLVMSEPFDPCGGLRVSTFSDPDGNELSIEGK